MELGNFMQSPISNSDADAVAAMGRCISKMLLAKGGGVVTATSPAGWCRDTRRQSYGVFEVSRQVV